MPFIDFDQIEKIPITPQHSKAYGELVTGTSVEVGRLFFNAGDGAEPHTHPQEQIVILLSGRARVHLGGEEREIGPGQGFHAPGGVAHNAIAIDDCVFLSCKNVERGVGHAL